jgi:hypothetical protein
MPFLLVLLPMENEKMTVRVEKLSRSLMRRSIRLLEMEYKPAELADELSANKDQIIRLVSAGAPARKDSKGHYWINGQAFARWLEKAAPKKDKDKSTFADNECWCVACRSVVTFKEKKRVANIVYGLCPKGHKTSRIFSTKKTQTKGKGK